MLERGTSRATARADAVAWSQARSLSARRSLLTWL